MVKVKKTPKGARNIGDIRNGKCDLCSLGQTAQYVCLMGRGPVPCDIMVVGEAPGFREDDIGQPFQGKAGQLLNEFLAGAGLSRDEIYITNVCKCRPPDNRTPTRKEISTCSEEYLAREIAIVKPKYVLLLGSVALQGSLKKGGVMKHRGEIIEKDGISYFITLHPAALFRQPQQMATVKADFYRFSQLVKGQLGSDQELNYTIVNSQAKLRQCITKLREADVVSYDLETSSLIPTDPESKVYCIGLAQEGHQWVIPLNYPGSLMAGSQAKVVRLLELALEDKVLVAHNGKFDNKWLKCKYGWDVDQTFDTMLASYLLDENSANGLKPLSKLYFNAPDYEIETAPIDVNTVSMDTLCKYCAFDVYYTLKLYHLFKPQLKEDKQLNKIFYHLLMPASKAMEDIEIEGVYLEPKQYRKAVREMRGRLDVELKKLNTYTDKIVNWNSTQQVANILYNDLKLPILEKTKTGNPSTSSENVLPRLKGKHPLVENLLKYREDKKLMEFLVSWGDHMDEGYRIHPNFLLHGTVTGRLSCRNPNLQQVPRDPFLRTLITAPPGWTFFEADYSQIELRIAAMISGDKTMMRAYQTGEDLHEKSAAKVMNIKPSEVTKEERKKAKAVNFGFIYGMGAVKFQEYARDKYGVNLTLEEAQEFRELFFDLYHDLPSWHERQRRLVRKFKYVRSPLGRKRRLPDVDSPDKMKRGEAERQSINSPVQSFASDLALFSMVRMSKEQPRKLLRPVGLVHDAILGMVKQGYEDRMMKEVQRIMTDAEEVERVFGTIITVPLAVEIKLGPWGGGKVWGE